MRRRTVLAAVGAAAVSGLAGCLGDSCPPRTDAPDPPDGWPTPGFDPANTGLADSSDLPTKDGEEHWRFDAWEHGIRGGASEPVADGERAYVATGLPHKGREEGGRLFALTVGDGEVDWEYRLPGGGSGAAALVGDAVVVGSGNGTLTGLEAATGDERWRTDLGEGVLTPAVANGLCYVQTADGRVAAVDAETGEECWTERPGGLIERAGFGSGYEAAGRPAVDDETVYVAIRERDDGGQTGLVRALERATGEERWTAELDSSRIPRSPVVADETVYIAARDRVYGLAAADGTVEWTFATGYWETSAPAVTDDVLYVSAKNIYAIDRETATERWRHVNLAAMEPSIDDDRAPMTSAPVVAGGAIVVGVGVLERETGELRWGEVGNREESDYFGAHYQGAAPGGPAVVDDALYVSTNYGSVVKVGHAT